MKLRISLIQMSVDSRNPDANLKKAAEMLEEASKLSPDVIVLPELWITGYCDDLKEAWIYTNSADELLKAFASSHSCFIFGGTLPSLENGNLYNECRVYSPEGLVGIYRKIHLIPLLNEHRIFTPGSFLGVFDFLGLRWGTVICYDIRFPELMRELVKLGAEIIVIPAEWPESRIEHWKTLLRARAIENQVFIAACNAVSPDQSLGGNSMVIDP
ncbi:MAG: hypothetical protein PWR09_701 [Archaeoglobi archaeon]|nr:hypothetical protein [Archaeoglobi archaeon]